MKSTEIIKKNSKIFFSIVLMSTVFTAASAQKGWNLEVIIEPQITSVGDYKVPTDFSGSIYHYASLKNKMTTGIETGAAAVYNFNDDLGIILGLLYSSEGEYYKDYTLFNCEYQYTL